MTDSEGRRTEAAQWQSEGCFRALVQNALDVITVLAADGTVRYMSPGIERELGYTPNELIGTSIFALLHPDDLTTAQGLFAHLLAHAEGTVVTELCCRHKDGSWRWLEVIGTSLLADPCVGGIVVNSRDITERKEAEQVREWQARYSALRADIGAAFTEHSSLDDILQRCAELVVRHLDAAFARVWLLDEAAQVLELRASAGCYTHLDGAHSHIPVGALKIGRIAAERRPLLTNEVLTDPWISDQEWAAREGMVAFAGYPLISEGRLAGVVALFARRPLSQDTLEVLAGVADVIAYAIERKRSEDELRASESRFRALVQHSTDLVSVLDAAGIRLYASPAYERILGFQPAELLGRHAAEIDHPDNAPVTRRLLAELGREPGAVRRFETRMRHRDGSERWLEVVAANWLDEPAVRGIIINSRDITERKVAEEALRRSAASLSEAQRIAHVGSWEWDLVTDDVRWSDETYRIYGYEPQEFPPTPERFLARVHPNDRERVRKFHREDLWSGVRSEVELRLIRQDGDERVVRAEAEIVGEGDGNPRSVVGTVIDVTERRAFEARLQYQAHHDPLTGLPNRTLFLNRLGSALAKAGRRKTVAVLFLDLDGFKLVNDSLGHEAGDRLLVDVGQRLQEGLPVGPTLARFGGDEFAILLTGVANASEATRVAEDMLQALRSPFNVQEHEAFVTATIGIAISGSRRADPNDLLREADTALYEAKAAGPAALAVYAPRMRAPLVQRLERQTALGRALERDELRLHYQPKVELPTGRVVGAEALVRWEHPQHGLLPPADFIGLAEETGLIVPLGRWVLREACSEASGWLAGGAAECLVCVNLSARQLRHPDLVSDVMQALEASRLDPCHLELEITEDVAMAHGPETQRTLRALKKLGVGLAIDDFGTGYSSLAYLRTLPVDALKVDRIFVAGLGRDAGSQAIVRAVTTLAHDLGLAVTAEGVETAKQVAWLRGIDVDLAQGYYFAPPLASEAVADLLTREARLPEGLDGGCAARQEVVVTDAEPGVTVDDPDRSH